MRRKFAILLAAVTIMGTSSAYALTETSSMNVNMEVYTPTSCSISAGVTMNFGTYFTTSLSEVTAQTQVTVGCTLNRPYTLYPDSGLYYGTSSRQMKHVTLAKTLPYDLYYDNSTLLPWSSTNRYGSTGTGLGETVQVYGRLPGGSLVTSNAEDGDYNDTVTMIVDYTP